MADGYARSTGKPGVCCVTTGPGVTNAATGLAVAHSDSIPVLLVSSNVHSEAAPKWRGLFHAVDQLALTKPITKWNASIEHPTQIPQVIGSAFRILMNGRPGAGHVEVPLDILQQEFEFKDSMLEAKSVESDSEPRNDSAEIRRAAQLLRTAKRPLVLAGGGVIAAEAWNELVEVCRAAAGARADGSDGKGRDSR